MHLTMFLDKPGLFLIGQKNWLEFLFHTKLILRTQVNCTTVMLEAAHLKNTYESQVKEEAVKFLPKESR